MVQNVQEIIGSNYGDSLNALNAGDVLTGGGGDDTLTSLSGQAQLTGGTGNDTYVVSAATDQITENPGEGTDTVLAASNYTLGANLENLTLHEYLPWDPYAGAAYLPPPPENWSAAGNDLANVITGNLGANVLSGLAGADTLTGGGGSDIFRDTAAGLNGDTITDFSLGDKIVISDATLAGFSFSLSGHTLTYTGGSLTLSNLPAGHLVAQAAAGGGVQLTVQPNAVHDDFNGDGRSDVLWMNDSGLVTDWLGLTGGNFAGNSNLLTQVPTNWHIAGTGDFNGDGRADVLWRSDDGTVTDWLAQADGTFAGNSALVTQVPTNWHIAGTGDFNGDGRADVLWRSDDGTVTDWLAQPNGSGTFAGNSHLVTQVPTNWHVAGTGDFNGDGLADVLWRSDDGTVTDWLARPDGSFAGNSNLLTQVPTNWHIAGTGDFNGDGLADVLWRSDDGTVTDWLAQGNGVFAGNSSSFNGQLGSSWHVVEIGDFNGDGRDDILWRNDDGTVADWIGQTNGTFVTNSNFSSQVPTDWHVQDPSAHDPFAFA
jgi:hypothetical protein